MVQSAQEKRPQPGEQAQSQNYTIVSRAEIVHRHREIVRVTTHFDEKIPDEFAILASQYWAQEPENQ